MLIAVDEEGGTVNRVSIYKQYRKSPFLSPQKLNKKVDFQISEKIQNQRQSYYWILV